MNDNTVFAEEFLKNFIENQMASGRKKYKTIGSRSIIPLTEQDQGTSSFSGKPSYIW